MAKINSLEVTQQLLVYNCAQPASLGYKAPGELALKPPVFLEADGVSDGDIFASLRKGHLAAVRAVLHLNILEKPDLRKRAKKSYERLPQRRFLPCGIPRCQPRQKKEMEINLIWRDEVESMNHMSPISDIEDNASLVHFLVMG